MSKSKSILDNKVLWYYLLRDSTQWDSSLKLLSDCIKNHLVSLDTVKEFIPPYYVYSVELNDFVFVGAYDD